ncbi:unnamed protein product [Lactuca saligna]|uniref:Uncharacterized protein n=1 Tax=Lactuca saligna TaxID=75948 RepID=A0AA35YCX2_LACSI|nr:unnamed protein product [Lactuca saligna]
MIRSNRLHAPLRVSYPYQEEDKVVPDTLEEERNYDPTIPLPSIPVSTDVELFEDEEETIKEEEQHEKEFSGVPIVSSPYSDSSSHQDREETHEEDPINSESSPVIVAPLPPSSSQSISIHALGLRTITTPRKFVPIPTYKRATSLPSSSRL